MDEIDKVINDILIFAGSRLKNYSIKANTEGMRSVMREAMNNSVEKYKQNSDEYLSMLEALKQVWNEYEIDDCKSPTANKVWAAIVKADPSLKGIR